MSEDATLLDLAAIAFKTGEYSQVDQACAEILAHEPNNYHAAALRAVAAARANQRESAIASFKYVLKIQPGDFAALGWLANLLREAGRSHEAAVFAERAWRARPADPEAAHCLGLCHCEIGSYDEAIHWLKKAIAIDPRRAHFFYGLGSALDRLGRSVEASAALRRGVELRPEPGALIQLGQFALSAGNCRSAIDCAERAIALDSGLVVAYLLMAKALSSANRQGEAAAFIDRAEALAPDSGEVHAHRASWLQANGRFDRAESAFRRSIEVQPVQGRAYYGVASCRTIGEADRPFVESIDRVLDDGPLEPIEAAYAHYALGKALDNLGDCRPALEHYDKANEIVRRVHPRVHNFDRLEFLSHIDTRMSLFTAEALAHSPGAGSDSSLPIFIVGMPRTGTTLVEQILSSHPEVGAGGERGFWGIRENEVVDFANRKLKEKALGPAAAEYCDMLASVAPGKRHVTDKNPANLLAAGLIHLALPNARIVCTHRQPVDMALSIYMTPVANPPPFACDRDNIVFAHNACLRLARHWRKVLPKDRFLEVTYEQLVYDRERVTRELLEFCGLDWDDACLHPEDNVRTIMTPSFWQVRQAVYTTSIDRWKRFEPWLGDFKKLL